MNFKRTINFKLDGIDSDFRIVSNPFSFSGIDFYQNNEKIKKGKGGFTGITYNIKNNEGNTEFIKVKGNGFKPLTVMYNSQTIELERDLTGSEKLMCFIPLAIFIVLIPIFGGMLGVIGGAMIGASVAFSVLFGSNLIRTISDKIKLLLMLVGTGIVIYAIYFILTLIISLIIYGTVFAII